MLGLYESEESALQLTSFELFGTSFHLQHPKPQLAALVQLWVFLTHVETSTSAHGCPVSLRVVTCTKWIWGRGIDCCQ